MDVKIDTAIYRTLTLHSVYIPETDPGHLSRPGHTTGGSVPRPRRKLRFAKCDALPWVHKKHSVWSPAHNATAVASGRSREALGAWPPLAPKIFFMQFSGNFKGKPQILGSGPPWGQNSAGPPLTKILHPRLVPHHERNALGVARASLGPRVKL